MASRASAQRGFCGRFVVCGLISEEGTWLPALLLPTLRMPGEGGEMASLVKCLPGRHEDQGFPPGHV